MKTIFLLILFLILVLFLLVILFFLISDIYTYFRYNRIFFVASNKKTIKKIKSYILDNFKAKEKIKIVDLGSGDGAIVFELAKQGYLVDGYELNPFLIYFSNFLKKFFKFNQRINFYKKDFLKADLSQYDVFIAYLLPHLMEILEKKLDKEAKKGAILISNSFTLKNKKPIKIIDNIYIYQF